MAFHLKANESLESGLQRVARSQLEAAIAEIDQTDLESAVQVHQVRKRLKKIRGTLRLVRPALGKTYRHENVQLRDIARELSAFRDARVHQVTYDKLMDRFDDQVNRTAFGSIRCELTKRRKQLLSREDSVDDKLSKAKRKLEAAIERLPGWTLEDSSVETISRGLAKTYKRGKERLAEVTDEPTTANLHQLRKRVKYHWHHCRLLQAGWPRVLKARRRESKRLSDWLGDDHDLAVLSEFVSADTESYGEREDIAVFLALLENRRHDLLQKVLPLANRLFAEKQQAVAIRFASYWKELGSS